MSEEGGLRENLERILEEDYLKGRAASVKAIAKTVHWIVSRAEDKEAWKKPLAEAFEKLEESYKMFPLFATEVIQVPSDPAQEEVDEDIPDWLK